MVHLAFKIHITHTDLGLQLLISRIGRVMHLEILIALSIGLDDIVNESFIPFVAP